MTFANRRCLASRIAQWLAFTLFFAALPVFAADPPITPERYNKGPRVLFNLFSEADKAGLDEIVPGRFYQKFWQSPHSSIQHAVFKRGPTGHVKTVAGYHGEEIIVMLEGELRFTFPDSKQTFTLHKGDVFNFPNILHAGECITDVCHMLAVYSPNRPDFGPEGTPMNAKTNAALADDQK
jgi:quercetin dioxygenase-like cupin family protein